jgi:hypothetical protein
MHELEEPDEEKRLKYCGIFQQYFRGDADILDEVFYT